jgi:hypothetical protein
MHLDRIGMSCTDTDATVILLVVVQVRNLVVARIVLWQSPVQLALVTHSSGSASTTEVCVRLLATCCCCRLVVTWLLRLVSPSGMPEMPLPEQVGGAAAAAAAAAAA